MVRTYSGIFDKQLKHEGFVWAIDSSVTGRFVIEIEFLDLKIADPSVSTVSLSSSVFCQCLVQQLLVSSRVRGVTPLTPLKSGLVFHRFTLKHRIETSALK
jgi:hypothetical protein